MEGEDFNTNKRLNLAGRTVKKWNTARLID